MTRTPVISSQISAVGYDPEKRKLEVQFKNGSVYEYDDVPEAIHAELVSAPSVGAYFNAYVKFGFIYRKL